MGYFVMKKILSLLLLVFAISAISCKKSQPAGTDASGNTSNTASNQSESGLNVTVTEDILKVYLDSVVDIVKEFKKVGFNLNASQNASTAAAANAHLNSFIKDKGLKDVHYFTSVHMKVALGWGRNKFQKTLKKLHPSMRGQMEQSAGEAYKMLSPEEKILLEKNEAKIDKVFTQIQTLNR